jgi:hypothetical protein
LYLGAASWTKQAILDCATAVATLATTAILDDWVARARAAATAIDDRTLLPFQRSRLQEAFRLLADALVLAATDGATERSSDSAHPQGPAAGTHARERAHRLP